MNTISESEAIHPTAMKHHRFHLLDGLRGVAAILVSAVHAPQIAQRLHLHSGFLAVDFFFCLSGFVVAFSYERRLAKDYRGRTFVIARLIRLYPVYLVAILAGTFLFIHTHYLILGIHPTKVHSAELIVLGLLMLPNPTGRWHPFLFPLDFPAWSMFYEIIANIAYAFSIRRFGTRLLIPWIAWGAGVATLTLGVLQGRRFDEYGWPSVHSLIVFALARVLVSFSGGVIVLRFYRSRPQWEIAPPLRPFVGFLVTAVILLLLFAPLRLMQTEAFRLVSVTLFFPVSIFFGGIASIASSWTALCSFLGDISYPFYLLNIVFIQYLGSLNVSRHFGSHTHLFDVLETASFLLISYGVAKYVDTPVRRYLSARFNAQSISLAARVAKSSSP